MHIHRYGTGEDAYVGLHGWGGSHTTFAPLATHLPTGASLYALDLPGYGWSKRPRAWTAAAVAAECAEAIDALDLESVVLVGNCSGAIIALLTSARLSTPVTRLVLIDPFAFLPWYFAVFLKPGWGRWAYYSTFANPIGRWMTNASLRRRRGEHSDLTSSFTHIDHTASLEYLRLLHAVGNIDQFADVAPAIDILYGERTFPAVKESLARWRKLWPHARVRMVNGVGHLPIAEASTAVARMVFRPVLARSPQVPQYQELM